MRILSLKKILKDISEAVKGENKACMAERTLQSSELRQEPGWQEPAISVLRPYHPTESHRGSGDGFIVSTSPGDASSPAA